MSALAQRRLVTRRTGDLFNDPVKAAVRIFEGAIVVLDAGLAAPGRTAAGLKARGIARAEADNSTGAASAITATSEKGIFAVINDGSVLRTHIGSSAWIVDDQTVAATDGGGTRSAAGEIIDVDAAGVWVKF